MSKEKDEKGVLIIVEDDSDLPFDAPKSGWRDLRGNLVHDPGYKEKLKLTSEQIELRKKLKRERLEAKNDKGAIKTAGSQSSQVSPSIRTNGEKQNQEQAQSQKVKRHRRHGKRNHLTP